jgi:4-amino-4-deoxy-L-arabinose transferase-like glycosyltransferase
MCYHMPLYYVVAGSLQLAVHRLGQSTLHFDFPANNPDWINGSPAMFVHDGGWGLAETPGVTAVRLFSLALGLLTVGATYHLAVNVYPGQPAIGAAAATLVAGWPQFVYMSRAVSNDLLATALSVLVLVILLQQGRSWRYPLAALLAGLACLTKLTAVFAAGIVVIAYLLEFWRHPERRKALLWPGLVMLAVFAATAALIGFVPILREHFQTGLSAFTAITPAARTAAYWSDVLQLSASSGWARFGWMNVAAPAWQAYAWWLFILAGVLAGTAALWRRRPALFLVAILVLWSAAVLAGYIRINLNRFQPQFRFAFALLPVLGTFAAGGYQRWLRRRPSLAVVLLALTLFLVNLWLIFQLVIPAYAI